MESSYLVLLLMLIATLAIIHIVQAQDQQGFISLDCGLSEKEQSPYIETSTGLNFSSDATFIQSGKTGENKANLASEFKKPYRTLRYFPDGKRNCYNLNVEKGLKYLIRTVFIYGNYDGHDTSPVFDLYLGPNKWATIDLGQRRNNTREDIFHIATSNLLKICLVKTGETTPLISAVELRPMPNDSYNTTSGSLRLYSCRYFKETESYLRYSADIYDRIWIPKLKKEWTLISTSSDLKISNSFPPPKDALKNAATPSNASVPLTLEWSPQSLSINTLDYYYLYVHFAEVQDLQANEIREFNLVWNGQHLEGPVTPPKLELLTVFSRLPPRTCNEGKCILQLISTNRSTHPPLINAYELYLAIQFPQSETDERDVNVIKSITASYALSRINWQGDPCFPQQLRWDGLNCTDADMSIPPRITSLNLSSSGLTGTIASAIQNLTQLEKLDLSNNNLTGEVPEFLGNMKSLLVINLSGNNLSGSLPQALQRKGLKLSVQGNPELCVSDSCRKPPKKNIFVPIVASVASAAIIVAMLVIYRLVKKKNSTILQNLTQRPSAPTGNTTFANKKSKRFKYSEVIKMTNNFQSVIGIGGFGKVYRGTVNSSEVAVKVLSQSSSQGYKEFKAEVELLVRVHHTNLVTLVGYCYEGDHLALIYEFLPNGDLQHHLPRRGGRSINNWSIRLRIALESAQGLEYLHIGCSPPMVHRDVKTANILLDENFKAKVADFGLSRSFKSGVECQESTVVAGTLGYLDPEYARSGQLSAKSDVYSFGVVLLEIITNQPVISQASEDAHIRDWVDSKLSRGDIIEIMDPNLGKDYDSNSAWRALEVAMSCADPSSSKRPSMSQVIHELKECIVLENSRVNNIQGLESQANISSSTSVRPMAR
ncbi:unnamed protein product [Eruca vesicaria subsp. sativa]|uniref:non-specific serine/threonine protein kinase n=1 Tax=Eruca vesicaria subsp. sativa TaxID=29727 RepID=A0ABC8IS00_ERUVS|nr:unnamed protein product [Eruca vesicaria subsp. sativa]